MSCPARASLPPMIPPMGPVPMTIMRALMLTSWAISLRRAKDMGSVQARQLDFGVGLELNED
jgi:hypothetical protein